MKKIITELRINQNQWFGVFLLFLLIISIQFFPKHNFFENQKPIVYTNQIATVQLNKSSQKNKHFVASEFNPNELSEKEWQDLGFSEKQAKIILKYKKSLGGNFTNKNQIKQCFVINERKFIELEPYLIIPTNNQNQKKYEISTVQNQEVSKFKFFNPNELNQIEWQKLGFSEKQAITILKYKKSMGGNFTTKDQIKQCYVISKQKFNELEPYLLIPVNEKNQKKEETPIVQYIEKTNHKNFNPNSLDQKGWQELGFSEKQAITILKYKNSLGGNFSTKDQIKQCYVISEKKFSELEPFILIQENESPN